MPQSDLLAFVFSDVFIFVKLSHLLFLHGIHIKMLVIDNHFLIELVDLFLLLCCKFLDHVIARDKDCLEVVWMRKCLASNLYLTLEVDLAFLCSVEFKPFQCGFRFCPLCMIRDLKLMHFEVIWLLGVLVPVFALHDIVETGLGLPSSFIFFLSFHNDLILINNRESKAEKIRRVSVELGLVLCNGLTELVLLEFPNVQFLVSILEHIYTLWNTEAFFWWSSSVH